MADWSDPELAVWKGDTDHIDFQVLDGDGNPQDVTGWDFVSSGKRGFHDADADALWQKTLGDGITARNAGTGLMTIQLDPADTAGVDQRHIVVDWRGRDTLSQVHTGDVRLVRLRRTVSRSIP